MNIMTLKKNNTVEIPCEIKLVDVGREESAVDEELSEEVRKLKIDVEELRKIVGWMEPVVKGI